MGSKKECEISFPQAIKVGICTMGYRLSHQNSGTQQAKETHYCNDHFLGVGKIHPVEYMTNTFFENIANHQSTKKIVQGN